MRNLSKSKIIAYRQCPKRLWLEIHKPELLDDSASEMVFAIGNQVATTAGIELASASLAHVDNSFVYPGGGDYRGLLKAVDLTDEVRDKAGEVATWIAAAQEIAALGAEPAIDTGPHCSDPFDCPFRQHCDHGKPMIDFPLSSLHRLGAKQRDELEALGYDDLRNVPDKMLSDVNRRIKTHSLIGEAWFDAAGAAADLAPHKGTAYFLDFETIGFGVPIWKGTRPYQQLPFQFSMHIVSSSGEMMHKEFLDLSGEDPSEAFARALIDYCGATGPVFVYNAGFENGVMRGLAERFPHHSPDLLAIVDRVVDLLPIARNRYYHPSQHGSWSIKAVLPAICPDLAYESLDGVQHGQAAQAAFLEAMAPETTPERKDEIGRQLLAYCKLDTLAMVRLWEFFSGKSPR